MDQNVDEDLSSDVASRIHSLWSMNQDDEDVFGGIEDDVFQDHTHPTAFDFAHASWERFAQDLTDACRSIFSPHAREYGGVHALLMNWVDDDLGTDTELVDMRNLFRDKFNYSTEIWKIPAQYSADALERKLSNVKAEFGGEDRLLIVYYGGHGRFDPSGRSIWVAYRNRRGQPKSPTLSWSTLQPMLQRAVCDVLIILDCCYAGSAARTDINGTNELLAACGRETTTGPVNDRSFTSNLLRKIRSFHGQPFTVNELYKRLLNDRNRLEKTPQYAPLSGRVRSSIVLAPLRLESTSGDLQLSVPTLTESGSSGLAPMTSTSGSLIPSSKTSISGLASPSEGPRVLIAVSLPAEASVPEIEQWKNWLSTDAPDDICRVQVTIDNAYLAHSTLLLVSVPLCVWMHLPDTSAYRFVDFIKSGNLLAPGANRLSLPQDALTVREIDKTDTSSNLVSDENFQSVTSTTPDQASTYLSMASYPDSYPPIVAPRAIPPTTIPPVGDPYSSRVVQPQTPPPSAESPYQEPESVPPPLTEGFTYDSCPLRPGDFRIFTIRQGSFNDPVEGTLSTCSVYTSTRPNGENLSYEALSYCWGSEKASCTIGIHTFGISANKQVRPNLYGALKRLRFPDRSRRLWIDAICINDGNYDEKNSQVCLMPEIYSKATHVCIWLGQASEDSDLALNFISHNLNLETFDLLVAENRFPEEWAALSSLMKRTWFNRRWVVQEIALAARATLYCGDAYVDWSDFADAVSLFEAAESENHMISKSIRKSDLYNHVPDFLGEIKFLGASRLVDATSNLFRKFNNGKGKVLERLLSLEALISSLSAFQASRPHDIIYAVLNLAKGVRTSPATSNREGLIKTQTQVTMEPAEQTPREQELTKLTARKFLRAREEDLFMIDYEKPFFDVCKEFLRFTIKSDGFLDIICRPWVPEDGIVEAERPSWLLTTSKTAWGMRPDGNYSRTNADTLVGPPGLGKRNYNASGSFKVTTHWKFGEGTKLRSMYVEGFVIDYIKKKKPYAADGIILNEWLSGGGWTDRSALPPDAFWRTLVADRGPNGVNPPTFYPRACKAALNQSVEGGHISTNTLVHNGKSSIVAKFLRRVQEVIWMRRLIITKYDFLGLAPEISKKQDLICILYGCSVPVVLRKMKDPKTNEEYCIFIGECYVHGIMDGEAFGLARARSRKGEIEKKVFELR